MIETGEGDISFFKSNFWDLWLQKMFRNLASLKNQWMIVLTTIICYGMFNFRPGTEEPWISAALGVGFLGGGFVTLALGRLVANTRLTENNNGFDTNK